MSTSSENSLPVIKTEEEIMSLFHQWCEDPIWDLESTEGFEAHHERLLQMRLEQDARWKAVQQQRAARRRELISAFSRNKKCSLEVAEELFAMNQQLVDLRKEVAELSEQLDAQQLAAGHRFSNEKNGPFY